MHDPHQHTSCATCFPTGSRHAKRFYPEDGFAIAEVKATDELKQSLATAIDEIVDKDGRRGYVGDCPAHISANLTSADVKRCRPIEEVLELAFDATLGLGERIEPGRDGQGYTTRAHAQDGNRPGRSRHAPHHDGFRSRYRDGTYVLVIAGNMHAEWIFERVAVRKRVRLTPGKMYLLLFSASTNAMAKHGVDDLPRTAAEGRFGARERYSMSGSFKFKDGMECSMNELIRCLRRRQRDFPTFRV